MAIQRWNPRRDLARLQVDVNRMFEEVLGRSGAPDGAESARPGNWTPPLDLFEESGHFVLRADLPGLSPADVEIRIEQDRLLLTGERKSDREAYLRMERPFGRFCAQVALPPSVDHERIHANHCNGVLEVVLPKKKKTDEAPSRIEVFGG
jgi:HSP20 family protein